MGESSSISFCVKLLVAKEENKVIMAETDREFIQVLFSFMIMPIASVVKNTRDCLSGNIGCLNNLYASIENLETNFLQNPIFQNVLLNPRSAAEIYCNNLELDLTENGCKDYFLCGNKECLVISYYNIGNCRCGEDLEQKIRLPPSSSTIFLQGESGFMKSTARFMIMDDFRVMPVAAMADLTLLNELGKYGKIEERAIKIGKDEVLKLLKCSLRSRTPLSETFLNAPSSNEVFCMNTAGLNAKDFRKKGTKNIQIKLIYDKVNNIALYAVVKEDFVNLLCTFLTFPLGYIFNQFPSLSFEGCLGNLHKSIGGTDVTLFCHEKMKEILVNPKLAPGLSCNNNLILLKEADIKSECPHLTNVLYAGKSFMDSMSSQGSQRGFDGFLKKPATFLVMDNLEVKPLSPISIKNLVDKLMVPLDDIDEQEMILDEYKAMRLLAASLASEHALTSTFLSNKTNGNCDCLDFLQLMWGGKKTGFKDC